LRNFPGFFLKIEKTLFRFLIKSSFILLDHFFSGYPGRFSRLPEALLEKKIVRFITGIFS
jgi:hypothetical protein